jgi:hypothetical protein
MAARGAASAVACTGGSPPTGLSATHDLPGATHSFLVAGEDLRTSRGQLLDLARHALRVGVGADHHGDDGQVTTLGRGVRPRRSDGRRQLAGRVRVAGVAEHHVEQQQRGGWVGGLLRNALDAQVVVHHGVEAAHSELILAQVDDGVFLA